MSSFAKLGKGNIVETVISIDESIATSEQAGVDFINNLYNTRDVWKQTFKDGSERKNYAGIGYTYDQTRDAFIMPKTFNSWTLNEENCKYEPPTEKPNDGKIYNWNEETTSWEEIE